MVNNGHNRTDNNLVVSACLVGICCRYDGGHSLDEHLKQLVDKGVALPVCPELLAGLEVPRIAAEIVGGDGGDVLEDNAKVMTKDGINLTSAYISGAERTLQRARLFGAEGAIFKDKSPACGVNKIYDGTFTRKLRSGAGVAAALLRANGISVTGA